jgi:hypothetical protein
MRTSLRRFERARLPIGSAFGQDPPDPAPGIGVVAVITRDEMNMDVRDSLSGGLSDIDTQVVASRSEPIVDERPGVNEDVEQLGDLTWRQIPEVDGMPARHDERVPRVQGMGIEE